MTIDEIREWMEDRLVDGEDGGYPLDHKRWVPVINFLLAEHDRLSTAYNAMRPALEKITEDETGEWYDSYEEKFHTCAKCQDKEYIAHKALEEV